MAYCSECGVALSDGAMFCPECGTAVGVFSSSQPTPRVVPATATPSRGAPTCPNCGAVIGAMVTKCPQCGAFTSKMAAVGGGLQSIGCLIMLVVFVIVPAVVLLWACATS